MRVLVTGANGFVGSTITKHLRSVGVKVFTIDKSPGENGSYSFQVDISYIGFLESARSMIPPCDAIVHAAASLDYDFNAISISQTNCLGTQQVIQLARNWETKNFIFLSSVPVIGIPISLPITEDHPISPKTAYHASKVYGEFLTTIAADGGMTTTILRLTSPIGSGQPEKTILSTFIKNALRNNPLEIYGKGTRRQNYVDVRDVATAVEKALVGRTSGLFNIGGSSSYSNINLAKMCINSLNSRSEIIYNEIPDPNDEVFWDVSIKKARKYLGFEPVYQIEESIKHIGEHYYAGGGNK